MRFTRGPIMVVLVSLGCTDRASPVESRALAATATAASSGAPAAVTSAATPSPEPSADPAPPLRPRGYARARSVPVHADPTLRGKPIGALASGDSVVLRDEAARSTPRCPVVRAIEPRGWICADGEAATLDASDPVWLALREHTPDYGAPLPYAYGESRGARRHHGLPGVSEPAWPAVLLDPHVAIAPRSTVAWLDEVEADGTQWLRASDMSFIRKDRVVPFEPPTFRGVALGSEIKLPLAFFKRVPHAKYRRDADDRLVASKETWPRLGWVALTGKMEKHGRVAFWETREPGVWLDARDAAIVAPEAVAPEGPHTTWIEVSALGGWLVAYEWETPVFATMISAGKLGAARPDPDHEPHQPPATTPTGTYRIKEKLVTATLQSDLDDGTEFVHAEVPWSQRFYDKYLLHTAYWHDQWGEGHSGGCVNLSPDDAKWLFGWTEPKVPEGWHSVKTQDGDEKPATVVVIHP